LDLILDPIKLRDALQGLGGDRRRAGLRQFVEAATDRPLSTIRMPRALLVEWVAML